MTQTTQSAGRRLSTITIDQAIAGASNVLIAVLAARVLSVSSFGRFGIVFIVYVTCVGLARAVVSEPLLVHPVEAEERPGDAIGTAGILGLGLGLVVAVAGALIFTQDVGLGSALLALAACMPLLVLQDLGRYLAFAVHRPAQALVLDSVWLALALAAVGIESITGLRSLTWFIAAWAGSGATAGCVFLVRCYAVRLRLSLDWLRETWSFSWRYVLVFAATQGGALVSSALIGTIAGVAALGSVRGAILLVSPFMTFQAASIAAGVAEISRAQSGSQALGRQVRRTTALTTLVAVLTMGALLSLPDGIGEAVLGQTWVHTKPLLLPAATQAVLLALVSGPRSGLLGRRAIRLTMRIDIVSITITVAAILVGVVLDGARGAYWALVAEQALVTSVWWISYLRYMSRGAAHDQKSSAKMSEHAG